MYRKDRSGEIINGLKLNKRIEDYIPPGGGRPLARYNCTCELCGKDYEGLYAGIMRKILPGCGCEFEKKMSQPRPDKIHDITNERFGRCVAKYRLENGYWMCLCDCGNWFATSLSHLTTGHTQSCGCYRIDNSRLMNFKNLTGQIFGKLTVIEYLYTRKFNSGASISVWLCLCECGSYTEATTNALTNGDTKSCGCLAASKRELEIREYLTSNKVVYKTEYMFHDLKLKNYLRYDFAIFDNNNNLLGLIEHYGIQHYVDNSVIGFGKQQREVTDKIKQDYCTNHHIKLFIIKYDEDIPRRLKEIFAELHVNTVPSA